MAEDRLRPAGRLGTGKIHYPGLQKGGEAGDPVSQ